MSPQSTSPQVFFFRHSFERNGRNPEIPGRFSFAASGSALVREGERFRVENAWQGHIYADGYANEQPAPNLDPNVFSDLVPWHLSFCRISDLKKKNLVRGVSLGAAVNPGDLVVFGTVLSTHIVAVDAVLCVARTPVLPKRGNCLVLEEKFDELKAEIPEIQHLSWESFTQTRTYRLNLRDAGPSGGHHTSKVSPYRLIIGKRHTNATGATAAELERQFRTGNGFNFIPLSDQQASTNRSIRSRPQLFCRRYENALRLLECNITKLRPQDGERLVTLLLREAQVLVLDPLVPAGPLRPHEASEVPLQGAVT